MGRQPTVRKRGGRSSRKRATVSSQFKVSVLKYMDGHGHIYSSIDVWGCNYLASEVSLPSGSNG